MTKAPRPQRYDIALDVKLADGEGAGACLKRHREDCKSRGLKLEVRMITSDGGVPVFQFRGTRESLMEFLTGYAGGDRAEGGALFEKYSVAL